jgi:hypothetical protein
VGNGGDAARILHGPLQLEARKSRIRTPSPIRMRMIGMTRLRPPGAGAAAAVEVVSVDWAAEAVVSVGCVDVAAVVAEVSVEAAAIVEAVSVGAVVAVPDIGADGELAAGLDAAGGGGTTVDDGVVAIVEVVAVETGAGEAGEGVGGGGVTWAGGTVAERLVAAAFAPFGCAVPSKWITAPDRDDFVAVDVPCFAGVLAV